MTVLRRTARPGEEGALIVDCGDNTDDLLTVERTILQADENVTAATITVSSKPTDSDDPTLGSPSVVASDKECNDRIVSAGQGFTVTYEFADDAALGLYVLHGEITTDQSRVIPYCIEFDVVEC